MVAALATDPAVNKTARRECCLTRPKAFLTFRFLRIIVCLFGTDRRRGRPEFRARRNRFPCALIPRGSHAATAADRRPPIEHPHERLRRQGILNISTSHVDIQSVSTIGELYAAL